MLHDLVGVTQQRAHGFSRLFDRHCLHDAGADLDGAERDLLGGLARDAQIAFGQVESEMLRARIEVLEKELGRASERR